MTIPETEDTEHRLAFGRYVLDLRRGMLLLDGREVSLGPRAFGVLRFLVEHPNRLVTKDELLAAAWPNLIVTDDTLVQSIGELRQALGETGSRLIVSVPRRGYRFEVAEAPPDRRKTHGWHALRFRWRYGILAPLAVGITVLGLWLAPKLRDTANSPDVAAKPGIAILPFQNQSEDPARASLAESFTQELIISMGRFPAVAVMPWNAVAPYKGAAVRPGEIARVLAVRYLVEGSVAFSGERVRVSAQLVDVQGRVLWASRFDEAATDVPALQDLVAQDIAHCLDHVGDIACTRRP